MNFDLDNLVRKNIRELKPYSSARSEFKGEASIFLDANENSFGSPIDSPAHKQLNRYPDPLQIELKQKISEIKGLPVQNIFLGNGSDECIDLLIRAFCEPRMDNILITSPTYGMYQVCADINGVPVIDAPLTHEFALDLDLVAERITANTKIIFLCSPNNPTGNIIDREAVEILLNNFNGLVVVDEAYVNYSRHRSFIQLLTEYPNLVVLQTFSKAWGLAGLRLGTAYASKEIIDILNKIKPPYNINQATQDLVAEVLEGKLGLINEQIKIAVSERERLAHSLRSLSLTIKVFPSEANFLLIEVDDAPAIYEHLKVHGIIVRLRSFSQCRNCLRITIGTQAENDELINCLKKYTE